MAEAVLQPNKTAQMAEFISMALGEKRCQSAIFLLKEDLERSQTSLAAATAEQLVAPAFYAIRDEGGGLHVDWNEGPIMAQTCNSALNDRNSPLSLEHGEKQSHGSFAWEGDNVEDGFEAFATWIQRRRKGRALINFPTYSDYYFALVVGSGFAEVVVAQLALVGLPSSVFNAAHLPTPSPVATISEVGEVVDGYGFESSGERVGRFSKRLNDDFSLVLTVSTFARYSAARTPLLLRLGLANHKMNALGRSILHDERMVETYPTIGAVASIDKLNECVSVSQTTTEWLDSVVSKFTANNIATEFKKATRDKFGGAIEAKLLTRLVNHDWPKVCDRDYLDRWDQDMRVAPSHRSASWLRAKAKSVRAYLDEHEIPYGDSR